ncbi:MAG: thiamine pyrophosphate-binding protein, partial [Chloroflexi bacterium]|nr:thiamine pyrophosphate-binding protein [Chloroflexota bacterium]
MGERTGWQMVVSVLKAEGIKYVFGLPGSPTCLYDALYDEPEIRPILVRHEVAGGFMAMAYALLTREPAVCFASPGPGIANLVPAMLESLATCAPVIAPCTGISGHKVGKGAFQETDQIGIMKPVTKWAVRVPYPERVPWAMRRAFSLATNGQPGPVFVEIPFEVGNARAEMPAYIPAERHIRSAGDPARVREVAALLVQARRPLIVAGGGLRASGAHAELRELAELLGMPVMTTPSGRGSISEDHPLAIGQVGLYRTRLGMQAFEEADLLITVGSRNEEFQTGAWRIFPPGAKFVQTDIESFEIGRNWTPDAAIVGDAKLVLGQLLDLLRENRRLEWEERGGEYAESKHAYQAQVAAEGRCDDLPLKTKRVLYELNQVFGRDTVLVHENGSQDLWSYYSPYYTVLDLDSVVAPGEQTCMGMGVAGAIGAKLALPDKKVVCVTGDGAFQMQYQELPTAVQHGAPVTWVVLDNRSLGWIKFGQKRLGERYISVDYDVQPDFVQLARACACYGERVEAPEQVRDALARALRANEDGVPAVVAFSVDGWDFS